jgi:hypothetical protein
MIAGTVVEIGTADAQDGAAAGKVVATSRVAMTATLATVATRVGTMVDSVADSPSAEVSLTVVAGSMVEGASTAAGTAKRQFC